MDSNTVSLSVVSKQLDTLLKTNNNKQDDKPKTGSILSKEKEDSVNVGMGAVYKSLTVLADEVIAKLNELLAEDLPDGIGSLNPEDHTSEATAQRIVDGATGLLAIYSKQNPNMQGEELIESFMSTIRGGITQGYSEAMNILGDIGAFGIDGVESGIEKTMSLVEEKLLAFEQQWREEHGLAPKETEASSTEPKSSSSSETQTQSQEPTSTNGTIVA